MAYDSTTKILISTGTSDGISRTLNVKVQKQIPSGLYGAITGNGNFATSGNITIDGRDHDVNGNVVGTGSYGISTSGTYSQGGSSTVGGNGAAPADPAPGSSGESAHKIPRPGFQSGRAERGL